MMSMDTGQVQVENAAYRADARRLPLDLAISEPEALAARLRALPGVAAVSERIDMSLELTNGVDAVRTMGRGVSQDEARVTDAAKKLVAGSFLEVGKPGLVIGKGLADKLGLKIGDAAYYTAVDIHSARNLGSSPVLGIFEFGYPLLDDTLVLMDLGQARAFLDLGKVATRLVVRGTDPRASAALTRQVQRALAAGPASAEGARLEAFEWKVFSENLVSTVETRMSLMGTILGVLFILITAGIFNTMAMNVQERYREIGTLRAIGIRRSGLRKLFFLEGLVVGLMGCLVAAIPSTIAALLLGGLGLNLSGIMPRDLPIPFGSTMYAAYAPIDALRALAAGLTAAALGSIVPAYRASRLPITEAIGTAR
jgi:putative ABC transport system permease protein